jgi:hypothetical protein
VVDNSRFRLHHARQKELPCSLSLTPLGICALTQTVLIVGEMIPILLRVTQLTSITFRWRTVRAWKDRVVIAERIEGLPS